MSPEVKAGGKHVLPWLMTIAGFLMTAGVVLWQGYRLMSDVETTIAFDWPIIGIGMILFAGGVSSFLYHPPSNRRNDNEN